jgi:dTDP-4-dehydrorhamnose reductase
LLEAWTTSLALREEIGADIRAVTAWSLFGSFDWNHLVTCVHDWYEPGVFDLRAPQPRSTALAQLVGQLARGKVPDHPILEVAGWWRRPERLTVRPLSTEEPVSHKVVVRHEPIAATSTRPVLVTGATGTLGRAFGRICQVRGITHRVVSRQEMDIAEASSVDRMLDALHPWAIVNTAGYVRVDEAETEVDRCMRENASGPEVLARACAARGTRLVTFSSDLVFDGAKGEAYVEWDHVAPLNVYGRSKADAERRVLAADPTALIVRTSAFFGPWDAHNFVYAALRALAAGEPFTAASDSVVSPTYVPDLVNAALDLLLDQECGLWHLANQGAMTWSDLAKHAAELADVPTATLLSRPTAELSLPAPRPKASALRSERGWVMPDLDDALARFLRESKLPCHVAPTKPSVGGRASSAACGDHEGVYDGDALASVVHDYGVEV